MAMEEHHPMCKKPAQEETTAPAGARNPSHFFGGVDSISSLPDEIIHHILSFVPTNVAIRTSVLSKRWRHVWCDTPYLSFPRLNASIESISKTLASYSAAKIMSLYVDSETYVARKKSHHVDNLIKFAISHNVEKLSLALNIFYYFPDFFFRNSSLKQLIVLDFYKMIPRCTVSWTSLRNLSLSRTELSDESFPKILSGSPMLESLTLQYCGYLSCLDLSESLCLRRLDIEFSYGASRKLHIVAPHIRYLRLIDFRSECTLADVPSLLEANIDTTYYLPRFWCIDLDDSWNDLDDPSNDLDDPWKDDYQVMLQAMLEKLQNVENLTVGLSFLQMLSIAEFRGVSFPMFKVKTLTLKTTILRSAVPGIAKLLQNSPGLKKIKFHKTEVWDCEVEKFVNRCLDPQYPQDLIIPAMSACKVPDLVASFIKLLLQNTRTLETLVVQLGSCLNSSNFDELSQIALTLSHKNKVSIVLK